MLSGPTPAIGGTYFQPCFDHHFNLIRQYASKDFQKLGKTANLSLKKANMVLITDGEGGFEKERIQNELESLPNGVETFFNLVNLQNLNSSLAEIAKLTSEKNAKSMVTHISGEQITKFIEESNNIRIDKEAFTYDKKKGNIPSEVSKAITLLKIPFADYHKVTERTQELNFEIKGERGVTLTSNVQILTELNSLIIHLRNQNLDPALKQYLKSQILLHYPEWTGHSLNRLNLYEEKVLREFLEVIK